jgi:dephospho-CoA kinase
MYFITGVLASGKSSLTLELRKKGFIAYDTDDDALARWQNNETGYIHPKSSIKAADRTEKFLSEHSWNVPGEFIENIAKEHIDKTVFICGVANNMDQLRDLFTKVFALTIDETTLRERLANRTNNDWGKQPHELNQTLELQRKALKTHENLGYENIDASQPIEKVVEDILTRLI